MKHSTLWLKWRILIITIPFTVIFCGVKWLFFQLGWSAWTFDALSNALVAATIFLSALVFSGILSDYKYSEALPADICSAIEAIQDCNYLESLSHTDYDDAPLLTDLTQLLTEIHYWLIHDRNFNSVLSKIAKLSDRFAALEPYSTPPLISRLQAEQAKLRYAILRIHYIRSTTFVPSSYTILELFTGATILALLFSSDTNFSRSLVISGFLFTAFVYLQILIRDLDNPFEYSDRSSADINLTLLTSTLERLQS